MANEIITPSENQNEEQSLSSFWRRLGLKALFDAIRKRLGLETPQTEYLLSNDDMCRRVELLCVIIKNEGEKTVKTGRNTFCRVFINQNSGRLEFRVGNKQQVTANHFRGLLGLEALVQIDFGIDGRVFNAVLADLNRQAAYVIGAGEYDMLGNVYGSKQFMSGVDRIGTITSEGNVSIPYTDEMKQVALQEIFLPINQIVWQLTEKHPARKT